MNERLARLRDWFDKLGSRERRLMSILGVAFVVFLVFLVPLVFQFTLSSRRQTNKVLRDAIAAIKNARDDVRKRQEKRDAILARYSNRPPPLAGLIEKPARDNHLDVVESRDIPEVPHGKKYVERATVVRLRKTGMLALSKTLEQIEQQRMPIAITRLNIRRRGGERDSYDVELGVSAFDRNETSKEAAPASSATGGSK